MDQQCEAQEPCDNPAEIKIDSLTPGGSIHVCGEHAPRCEMLRGHDVCGAPAPVTTISYGVIIHFCDDCATWGL